MSTPETPDPIRILAFCDSESYLKWACALLSTLPDVIAEVRLIRTPILPTPEQIAHAVDGSGWAGREIPVIGRHEVATVIERHRPDIVLGASTGPVVAQVFLTAHRLHPRPALVSGLPGMGLPARGKGLHYRRLMDAFIAHSTTEVAEYTRVSAAKEVPCEVLLARLPMLRSTGIPRLQGAGAAETDSLVFAPQAKVPADRADRKAILLALASFAERHPGAQVVLQLRSRPGEHETHHEEHSYVDLLADLRRDGVPGAEAIEFGFGPLDRFLTPGSALVTVSSTAALESIDRGLPTLLISDFGIDRGLLNEVFADSGATGTLAEVASGTIGFPSQAWLAENYFHPADGALRTRLGLLALRARQRQLPYRRGAVWKQKRLLLRAELRTITPPPVVRAYRRLRRAV